ncbi:MAG TPA: hypothetical protein VGD49_05335 [Longimicrobiales bacterium]
MIAPSGTGRAQWRRLIALWIGAVVLLIILILTATQNERRFFLGVWLVLSLPLAILTAIWWSERDNR